MLISLEFSSLKQQSYFYRWGAVSLGLHDISSTGKQTNGWLSRSVVPHFRSVFFSAVVFLVTVIFITGFQLKVPLVLCTYRFGNGDISTVQCHCFYVYCAGLIYLKYTYLPSHKIGLGTLTKHQILANRRYQIYSQAYILPEAEEEEAAKNTTNFMSLKLVTCLCVYKYFRVFLTNFAFFYLLLSF